MSIELLEVSWRVGAERYSFVLTPDGTPHLVGPGLSEAVERAGAAPGPPSGAAARPGPARRGQAWSEDEEAQLRAGYTRGDAPAALATALGRTAGSIRARLVRLGLLDEAAAGLRYPVARAEEKAGAEAETGEKAGEKAGAE